MEKYLDFRNEIDYIKLKQVAESIVKGKIVVFPTETVYGIGANAFDEKAVKRLYDIKQRNLSQPTSVLVSNMEMINSISEDITDVEYKIMEKFFPGPLTIILKKKNVVPNIVTANQATIGVRMPNSEIARKLVEYANVPIATPSANISGKPSGTQLEVILEEFKDKVDYFIDGGASKLGVSSTIVKVVGGTPQILRQGSITKEQIDCIL